MQEIRFKTSQIVRYYVVPNLLCLGLAKSNIYVIKNIPASLLDTILFGKFIQQSINIQDDTGAFVDP